MLLYINKHTESGGISRQKERLTMDRIILKIAVNKDNIYSVLKHIEEIYPHHRWNGSDIMPTDNVPPNKARAISLYSDNTICYSEKVDRYTISADEFLSDAFDKSIQIISHINVLIDMFGADAVRSFLRCSAYVSRIAGENSTANCYEDLLKDLCK